MNNKLAYELKNIHKQTQLIYENMIYDKNQIIYSNGQSYIRLLNSVACLLTTIAIWKN